MVPNRPISADVDIMLRENEARFCGSEQRKRTDLIRTFGAGDEDRTRDVQLGKPLAWYVRRGRYHMMFAVANRATRCCGMSRYLPYCPAISPPILGDGWVTAHSRAYSN